jgi:5-methyltetrahydropteroyltriglutamate--homocysteine methyltransferase
MGTVIRAEHVGSLLRPPEVLEARRSLEQGRISLQQLREVEDRAALANIQLQREAGMEVFTDGEVRRANWMAELFESIGGVAPVEGVPTGEGWHRDRGPDPSEEETHFALYAATDKVTRKLNLSQVEADFLARHAPGRFKVTMMSSSMGSIMWFPGLSERAYPTPDRLVDDLARLQAEEIDDLVGRGVSWIQLDSLSYMQLIDPDFGERIRSRGSNLASSLDRLVAVDNALVRAAKARNPEVTVGLHFCRGNNRSAWAASGSYEPVAEKLFGEVDVDRFLLEYDTERAGGFEPLRFVPRGKIVVLGLISSKLPELESQEDLRRRIDEASRYVPLEYLALSPQCGFASTAAGNLLTVDDQRRKLELVVDTARMVWGTS